MGEEEERLVPEHSSTIAFQPEELMFRNPFFICCPTYIWDLEYEEENNGEHIEPESEPGACRTKSDVFGCFGA